MTTNNIQRSDWHIIPKNDLKEHLSSNTCWCNPTPDETEGCENIWIHNSLDGRESKEDDRWLSKA